MQWDYFSVQHKMGDGADFGLAATPSPWKPQLGEWNCVGHSPGRATLPMLQSGNYAISKWEQSSSRRTLGCLGTQNGRLTALNVFFKPISSVFVGRYIIIPSHC